MSEEKTEQATPRRREQAREKGQIAQSKDLNNALLLVGVAIFLNVLAPSMFRNITNMVRHFFSRPGELYTGKSNLKMVNEQCFVFLATTLGPLLAGILALSILVHGVQTKFALFKDKISISLEKLDPIKNLQNMFSMRQAILPVLIVGKLTAVIIVGYFTIVPALDKWMGKLPTDARLFLGDLWSDVMLLIFRLAILLVIIGIVDYAVQWRSREKNLMMTKQEIKEELKREEGSPHVKQQMRRRFQELSQARMMEKVPESTVVITNPTALAIAIKYNDRMYAPEIVAKGRELVARRIREIAGKHEVPIVENKALARLMYKNVEIGKTIPPQFFEAVAGILAYVYRELQYREAKT